MGAIIRNRGGVVLGVLVLLATGPAAADTYSVDRFDDSSTASSCMVAVANDCSLRGAIIKANGHSGDDTVVLKSGTYTLSLFGRDEDLGLTGDLDVRDGLTIVGRGPKLTVIDADGIDRVLHVLQGGERLTVRGVTIAGGDAGSQSGGGIFISAGLLRLDNCWVIGNVTNASGGGIYDFAASPTDPLEIIDTLIAANVAQNSSALWVTSPLILDRSTVCFNSAGAVDFPATVNVLGAGSLLRNSTIASNSVPGNYGGVMVWANGVVISGCTLADNSGAELARSDPWTLTLANSVIKGICAGSFNTIGGNLESPGNTCGFGASDLVNVADPMLSQLLWTGGPTMVQRPLPGSPAIDRTIAAANCPSLDQRGLSRPRDGGGSATAVCDIGAVELAAAEEIFVETFDSGFTTPWSEVVP